MKQSTLINAFNRNDGAEKSFYLVGANANGYLIYVGRVTKSNKQLIQFLVKNRNTGRVEFFPCYYPEDAFDNDILARGLCLDGGIPEWDIEPELMQRAASLVA